MKSRHPSRVFAGLAVAALVGVGSLLAASSANAADPSTPTALGATPAAGAAIAIGGDAGFAVNVGPFSFTANDTVGVVAVKTGHGKATLVAQKLIDLDSAQVTLATVNTVVNSDANSAEAGAIVGDTSVDLFGVTMLQATTLSSSVGCPVSGAPELFATAEGLTLLGIPTTLSDGTPVAEQTAQLPADVPNPSGAPGATVDLSSLSVTVIVTEIKEAIAPGGATSVALTAEIALTGTLGEQVFSHTPVANIQLAEADCEKPATPFGVTAITPSTGSTAGGESVSITGTGFTPETTVAFGTNAATSIIVDPSGTSLTAVTPAGDAGAATVTVTTPGSTPATLSYSYVDAVVPTSTPTPTVTAAPVVVQHPAGGAATLAETGIAAGPIEFGALALLALGGAGISVALVRRRA